MSFQNFLKKSLMQFFIITTCINVAIGILGLSLDPERRFGYDAYFSPLIFGFLSLLPSFITYSSKELTLMQTLIRKFFHWAAIEVLLIAFSYMAGLLKGQADIFFFALTVFIVYLSVNLFSWGLAQKDAVKINAALETLQRT